MHADTSALVCLLKVVQASGAASYLLSTCNSAVRWHSAAEDGPFTLGKLYCNACRGIRLSSTLQFKNFKVKPLGECRWVEALVSNQLSFTT